MTSPSGDRRGSADIVPSELTTRQNTADEKGRTDSDPERLQPEDGQTTRIDPDVAKRIAANVEDFMVSDASNSTAGRSSDPIAEEHVLTYTLSRDL